VSYDAVSRSYSITTAADTTPTPLIRDPRFTPAAGAPWTNFVDRYGMSLLIRASGAFDNPDLLYFSSNLAAWGQPTAGSFSFFGHTAFGIATPGNALPPSGTFTYAGFIEGSATESFTTPAWGPLYGGIKGSVTLTVDLATSVATITIRPILELDRSYTLPAVTGVQLVFSRATSTFHQPVPGNSQSLAYPLSGRFTGPTGEELIGGLTLNYVSPVDGRSRSADVAFIAKRPGPFS
jgi:hypothetical protein